MSTPSPSPLSERVPRDVSEVTKEWLSAVMKKSLANCENVNVLLLEGEKEQNGLLSLAFR